MKVSHAFLARELEEVAASIALGVLIIESASSVKWLVDVSYVVN